MSQAFLLRYLRTIVDINEMQEERSEQSIVGSILWTLREEPLLFALDMDLEENVNLDNHFSVGFIPSRNLSTPFASIKK